MTEDNDRLTINEYHGTKCTGKIGAASPESRLKMRSSQCYKVEVPPPSYNLSFHKETEMIGKLDWSSGKLVFEGNVDESAKLFFDWLKQYIDLYIEHEIKRSVK